MIHSGSSNNEYAQLFLNIVSNQGQLTPVQRQGFPEDMSHHRSDMTNPSSSSTPTRFRSLKRTTRWTERRSARFPWEGLTDRVGDLTGTPQGHGVAHSVGLSRAVG